MGTKMDSALFSRGDVVRITESWGSGREAIVQRSAVRDGCPEGEPFWSYDLGGLVLVPEWQLKATGKHYDLTRTPIAICPEHGEVFRWIAPSEPEPRGCNKDGCSCIVQWTEDTGER